MSINWLTAEETHLGLLGGLLVWFRCVVFAVKIPRHRLYSLLCYSTFPEIIKLLTADNLATKAAQEFLVNQIIDLVTAHFIRRIQYKRKLFYIY